MIEALHGYPGSLHECQMIFAQGRVKDAEALDIADHLGGGLYKLVPQPG
jgi:hypothetical protein